MPTAAGMPAYKDALKLLIAKLRRDLERPDMNIVIGRLSDAGQKKESWAGNAKDPDGNCQ